MNSAFFAFLDFFLEPGTDPDFLRIFTELLWSHSVTHSGTCFETVGSPFLNHAIVNLLWNFPGPGLFGKFYSNDMPHLQVRFFILNFLAQEELPGAADEGQEDEATLLFEM